MEFDNSLEKEFQVRFPYSLNERIKLSLSKGKPFVFQCYNFQEFIMIGSQLLGESSLTTLRELKKLTSDYPILKEFIPIAYNSLSYYPSVLCLKSINGICEDELYYFQGIEKRPTFFVETNIPILEVLDGDIDDNDGEFIRHNSCKKTFEYYFEKFITVSGYGTHINTVINDLNSLLEIDDKYTVSGRKIFLNNQLVFEYADREDEFIPNDFFKVIENKFSDYCWFQAFINWDLEHWGFGKISVPNAKEELTEKGYRKFFINAT